MTKEEIIAKKDAFIEKHGKWEAHNVYLGEGVYTVTEKVTNRETRLRRLIQLVRDNAPKPFEELSLVDLACAEGVNSIGFARAGMGKVLGIEAREKSVEKANCAKEILGLDNVNFQVDDVRNLSPDKHGRFDVVLSTGILYHLEALDVCRSIQQMYDACNHMMILDTEISLFDRVPCEYEGETYWGVMLKEHDQGDAKEVKVSRTLSSIDNAGSWWITRPSLLNLLHRVGFTTVFELPRRPGGREDRIILVAIKGKQISDPSFDDRVPVPGQVPWPERAHRHVKGVNVWFNRPWVPGPIKSIMWRLFVRARNKELVSDYERVA
ncbi:MAG: class I SAM-dependent methyltransferase [Limisphaerales bacterium]